MIIINIFRLLIILIVIIILKDQNLIDVNYLFLGLCILFSKDFIKLGDDRNGRNENEKSTNN